MRTEQYLRLYETDLELGGAFMLSNVKLEANCINMNDCANGDEKLPGLVIRADYSAEGLESYLNDVHFYNMDVGKEIDDVEVNYAFAAQILHQVFTERDTEWKITSILVGIAYVWICLCRTFEDGRCSRVKICLKPSKECKLVMGIDIVKRSKRHYMVKILSDTSYISVYKRKKNGKLVLKKEMNFLEEKYTDFGSYIYAMVTEYHKS